MSQIEGPGGMGQLLSIAAPLILSSSCDTVMMFADRLFLSRLSGAEMAAVMAGGLAAFTFQTFIIGLCGYSNAMVANRYGAGLKTVCPVVTTQALLISLAAYPLMIACIPLGYWIFAKSGIDPSQLFHQRIYFTVLMLGSLIGLLRNCIANFFSGIGRTRIVMAVSIISMIANVGLNYILVFGKAGIPALGILGAAIGTVSAGFIGLVILTVSYLTSPKLREFRINRSFRFEKNLMAELWRRGMPSGVEMLLNLISFTMLVTAFHSCGTEVATAITITFSWDMVSFVPMIGLHIAVMSLAGRFCGSEKLHLVNRTAWSAMKLSAFYSSILFIVYIFYPEPLVDLFLSGTPENGSHVRQTAIFMVRLISIYLFCDGMLQVFGGALKGAGDTFWVMTTSVIMHWSFALFAVVALHVFGIDAKTTWLGVILVFILYGPVFLWRFLSGGWKKMAWKPEKEKAEYAV